MEKYRIFYGMVVLSMLLSSCSLELKSLSYEDYDPGKTSETEEEYWDERVETVTSPPLALKPNVKEFAIMFQNDFQPEGFAYVYGGNTAYKIQPGSSKKSGILACYMDNKEYSGVTIALGAGKNIDLESYRTSGSAGLAFWAKGGKGVRNVYLGLLDDGNDDKKIQTKLMLSDFGTIDTNWHYYMVPIRMFQGRGFFWDASKKAEILGDVDWKRINEVRFSSNKSGNRVTDDEPVVLYVDDVAFVKEIPGYVNPDDYWKNFHADASDLVLHDFEDGDSQWETSIGPKSSVDINVVSAPAGEKKYGKGLAITYQLSDWCDVTSSYTNRDAHVRNWTSHWGIKFDLYTDKAFQPVIVQISDSGNELFFASAGGEKGWTEVIIPFKEFAKFPFYQPDDAVQNGAFDLDAITMIDFKQSGSGATGTYIVDNVTLTNDREAKKRTVAEKMPVTITGSFDTVLTKKIHDGIFGINVTLSDGDLLSDKSVAYVKAVHHAVLRFPGGLRADVDNWKEVLAKKDERIDIDEFLGFCKKTGTIPMITVNFGTGTVKDAADWVRYCNKERKARVKYWEVGNELYGDWHPNYCSAEEYGKRAREYIAAMKQVDSSIVVTVVGVLDGEWNRVVFNDTKDIVDGLNVHHYAQGSGSENDAGLLSSPQALGKIVPDLKKFIAAEGIPGKQYQLWLTEWNSVDFNPGPQSVSIVNALFAADYLGIVATQNIEQASYWNIHDVMTVRGGDYGYLSRTGAPDGDNVPRPSYWAFKMASDALGRGELLKSETGNEYITSYLTNDKGRRCLMIINKYPKTRADVTIAVPGFSGKATVSQLDGANQKQGLGKKAVVVDANTTLALPPYSITTIALQ